MTAQQYKDEHKKLMDRWKIECREWAHCNATFYLDGAFDADIWFDKNNNFRPLFVLKEVNEATSEANDCVNFVGTGDDGSDPWKGEGMWSSIGALAVAMFQMHKNPLTIPDYNLVRATMNLQQPDIETERQRACRKIAVINLKKLAGGTNVNSEKSQSTLGFTCHAQRFADNLAQQIKILKPTVIICCGKTVVANCLDMKNGKICSIAAIDGYHPKQNSTENFYYKTLREMQDRGLFN